MTITQPWLTVASEEQSWRRSVQHAVEGTYRSALVPAIADRPLPPISTATGDLLTQAASALIRLDATVDTLAPARRTAMSQAVTALEATHSAAIDAIHTSALSYNLATIATDVGGYDLVADLAAALTVARTHTPRQPLQALQAIHGRLLGPTQRVHAGVWRAHQTWQGASGEGPQRARYVPPAYSRIPAAMDDLAAYASHSHGNALSTAAIAYAHLLAIRPFAAGNGRAGRAWITHLATTWSATRAIPVPLSYGLRRDLDGHEHAVYAYLDGNPEPIIGVFGESLIAGVTAATGLIAELADAADSMHQQLADFGVRTDSCAWAVAEYLLGQPVTTNTAVAAAVGTDRSTAYRALQTLAECGIIKQSDGRFRDRFPAWEAPQILAIAQHHHTI